MSSLDLSGQEIQQLYEIECRPLHYSGLYYKVNLVIVTYGIIGYTRISDGCMNVNNNLCKLPKYINLFLCMDELLFPV